MPRSLNFKLDTQEFFAPIEKIERSKLYGRIEKHHYDRDGNECYFGSLSSDGTTIFTKESFEAGYLSEGGQWLERSELKAVDISGKPLEKIESSFNTAIELTTRVSIDEYLQYVAKSVYQLESPELLKQVKQYSDEIFCFTFNYMASYQTDTAFLIENEDSLFMVIGQACEFQFIEPQQIESPLLFEDEDEDESEDIDFSMF